MNNDIVDDMQRGHNKSPGKMQIIASAARPPKPLGVGYTEFVVRQAKQTGIPVDPFFDPQIRLLLIPVYKNRPRTGATGSREMEFPIKQKKLLTIFCNGKEVSIPQI